MQSNKTHLKEIQRRRTFAIISHPDAGKTTLTEKLLLYGGAIHLAGSVTSRKNRRQATSDWMELEKQRGISITSTVLQFEYAEHVLNLLDTPGHQDFSEDTYRTLVAADSAIMLIDSAKGVEPQTRKLFEVCRQRGLPIFTFMNKLDRPGKDPFDLLAEIEHVLGIHAVPVNWPIGNGQEFKGVYDRLGKKVHLFSRTELGAKKVPVQAADLHDSSLKKILDPELLRKLREDIELLDGAGETVNQEKITKAEITPVFFGSASNNFGVELFLRHFLPMAPSPLPRAAAERIIQPEEPEFRGFVFKIQANMNPHHRDRIAFVRIVSGKFERDITVLNPRLGKPVRLTRSEKIFAQKRDIVDEAYPGDIIGLTNPGAFHLGDTVCAGEPVHFKDIPRFLPEHFALIQNATAERYKQFQKGIVQLAEEGVAQLLRDEGASQTQRIVAVVGLLQFDVIRFRLQSEYDVKTSIEMLSCKHLRWIQAPPEVLATAYWGPGTRKVRDGEGNLAVLIKDDWGLQYMVKENPEIKFLEFAPSNPN